MKDAAVAHRSWTFQAVRRAHLVARAGWPTLLEVALACGCQKRETSDCDAGRHHAICTTGWSAKGGPARGRYWRPARRATGTGFLRLVASAHRRVAPTACSARQPACSTSDTLNGGGIDVAHSLADRALATASQDPPPVYCCRCGHRRTERRQLVRGHPIEGKSDIEDHTVLRAFACRLRLADLCKFFVKLCRRINI